MNNDININFIRNKIQSKEYSHIFANILYRYYIAKKDPIFNLENVRVMGFGKVTATNYSLVNEKHPLCWNYNDPNTFHFLVLRNEKNKKLCGFLLPPLNNDNYIECKSFQYAFPIFDVYDSGRVDESRVFFANVFNEQIECEVYQLEEKTMFYDLLSDKQIELNKILVENNNKESTPLLSTIIFNYMK